MLNSDIYLFVPVSKFVKEVHEVPEDFQAVALTIRLCGFAKDSASTRDIIRLIR